MSIADLIVATGRNQGRDVTRFFRSINDIVDKTDQGRDVTRFFRSINDIVDKTDQGRDIKRFYRGVTDTVDKTDQDEEFEFGELMASLVGSVIVLILMLITIILIFIVIMTSNGIIHIDGINGGSEGSIWSSSSILGQKEGAMKKLLDF